MDNLEPRDPRSRGFSMPGPAGSAEQVSSLFRGLHVT